MRTKIYNDEICRNITVVSIDKNYDLSDDAARIAAENELQRLGDTGWYFDGITRENWDKAIVHFIQ